MLSPLLLIAVLNLISRKTPLCRRPGPGAEWQTGATGDIGGVEQAVYQTRAEN